MDNIMRIGQLLDDLYWVGGVSRVRIHMEWDTIKLSWSQRRDNGDWYPENMTYLFSQSGELISKLEELRNGD